jgi:hypothetical protein
VRPCSDDCLCRSHEPASSSGYAFIVRKNIHHITVKVQSDSLFAQIVNCTSLEALSKSEDARLLDGFKLLRHHATLKKHLLQFASVCVHDVLLELRLLIDGFLGEGQVFRGFGYERLYEHGHLDYELWRAFQQQRFDSDIDDIDDTFRAVEDDEITLPPIKTHTSHLGLDDRSFGTIVTCGYAGNPHDLGSSQICTPYITTKFTYQVEYSSLLPKNNTEEDIPNPISNIGTGHQITDEASSANFPMRDSPLNRCANLEAKAIGIRDHVDDG